MANELCVSGFGNAIDGNYKLEKTDRWTNETYWIYKDSYFWIISSSPYLYETNYVKAIKKYIPGSWVDGDYYAVGPWVNGEYTTGAYLGHVSLGIC